MALVLIFLSVNTSCKKEVSKPNITTSDVSEITDSTAFAGGFIDNDGGASVIACGVCFDTVPNPTILNNKTKDGSGIGTFISKVYGLMSGTTYHVRAYATNSAGTSYGSDIKFTTTLTVPKVKTICISAIASNFAICYGTIKNQGMGLVTAKGICWGTNSYPTISDNKTIEGTGIGDFNSSINGLSPQTTYYLRAYATNNLGTGYGNQLSFKTGYTITDYDGNVYNTVTIGTQVWMVENLKTTHYNNGDLIGTTSSPILNVSSETNPKYQWAYNGDDNNVAVYGRLYTWYALTDSRGICPVGWHAPNYLDFQNLIYSIYDGSYHQESAGGPMKEAGTKHWLSPNAGASDSCGFTALPGGYRDETGTFKYMGKVCYFWMPNPSDYDLIGGIFWIWDNDSFLNDAGDTKYKGFSIRCLKDN